MTHEQRDKFSSIVLTEDTQISGQDAQESNIAAATTVAEMVRTTLGPMGMDKMLLDKHSDIIITNDGTTILDAMDIEHPAARMIVEITKENEAVGGGSTSAVVFAGHLLSTAQELLENDIHPTVIADGYNAAAEVAREIIDDLVLNVALDAETLQDVAVTSITGTGAGDVDTAALATLVVDAVQRLRDEDHVERDDIYVTVQAGKSATDHEFVEGFILDDEPVLDTMERRVEDATTVHLDMGLGSPETKAEATMTISDFDQFDDALTSERVGLREHAELLAEAGVDVLFSTGTIDDQVATHLDEAGIVAFDGISEDDEIALARVAGARWIGTLTDFDFDDFGHVESIQVEKYGENVLTFVEGGGDARAVTLFVRGGTDHVVAELERTVEDTINAVVAAVESGAVVPGGGAVESTIASGIRDSATSAEDRKQLAIEAYADALEVIPRTLAQNAGLDQIDALVRLRAGNRAGRAGVIVTDEAVIIADPVEFGILDPAPWKYTVIEAATEVAAMIVRIDHLILAEMLAVDPEPI